ncbi:hypothetical protein AMTRI_Chr03g142830 [Amborella trichopoda]
MKKRERVNFQQLPNLGGGWWERNPHQPHHIFRPKYPYILNPSPLPIFTLLQNILIFLILLFFHLHSLTKRKRCFYFSPISKTPSGPLIFHCACGDFGRILMANGNVTSEQVVLEEDVNSVRLITLNRPRLLNVLSPEVVFLLAKCLEKWELEETVELVLIKGAGRAFSAGGDLKVFFAGKHDDSCLEVVYRMYWLLYHFHTYKKTQVALVHGLVMGGGASLVVPSKFSVVTEKTVFAVPEASIGFHTDCSFSYILSHLPEHLGEYLAVTGARLDGKEMIAAGLATHFVPSEKLAELEKRLISLNSGDENAVRSVIEEFFVAVEPDEKSVLHKQSIINKCFSKNSMEEIIDSFEEEAKTEGNECIKEVLKGLKRSSPTGLKIALRSVREGRKQTLEECMKKEFRLTMNILRQVISGDVYEGIRALVIDKDNAPKWDPPTLNQVRNENLDKVFQPFQEEMELQVPSEESRWSGKFENSAYQLIKS